MAWNLTRRTCRRTASRTGAAALLTAALLPGGAVLQAAPAHALFVPVVPSQATNAVMVFLRTNAANLDPITYADRAVRAWGRGDRATTAAIATAEVTAALFAHATSGGKHWVRVSAPGAASTRFVTYSDVDHGKTLTLGVDAISMYEGGTHLVYRADFTIEFTMDGSTASRVHLADLLVPAWGRGDRGSAETVATAAATARLFAHSSPGGRRWRRTAVTTAGATYVTYTNGDDDERLVVEVSNPSPQQGPYVVHDERFVR